MLVLMSCWTTTSLASYFPSRSQNPTAVYPFQDSSNFYLVMSARDDRDLVNCQGPCHQVFRNIPLLSLNTRVGQLADQASREHHRSVSGDGAQRRDQEAAHGGRRDGGALASGQAVSGRVEGGAQLQIPPCAPAKSDLDHLSIFIFYPR